MFEHFQTLLPFVTKKETDKETTFIVDHPPHPGMYKLQIFARRKPKKRGLMKIPLVATLLVDFRHTGQNIRELDYNASGSTSKRMLLSAFTAIVASQSENNNSSKGSNRTSALTSARTTRRSQSLDSSVSNRATTASSRISQASKTRRDSVSSAGATKKASTASKPIKDRRASSADTNETIRTDSTNRPRSRSNSMGSQTLRVIKSASDTLRNKLRKAAKMKQPAVAPIESVVRQTVMMRREQKKKELEEMEMKNK